MDVNKLNHLIAAKDAAALAALEALDDFCIEDDAGATLAAAAIRSGNEAALEIIARSKAALEYCPPIDKDAKRLISMQAGLVSFDEIERTEEHIGRSVGNNGKWARTPLLDACRHGNRDAIRLLVEAGAKLNATDALKESALSLCMYHGRELALFFIECAADNGKTFPVTDDMLVEHIGDAELVGKLTDHGRLTKKASHFVFCLACALLDRNEIIRQLDAGYKLSDKRPYGEDPLLEIATSRKLAELNHPKARDLARGEVREKKDRKANLAISSTPLEDLAAVLDALPPFDGEEDAEWSARIEAALPQDIDPVLIDEAELRERIDLMDLLVERGLDARRENPRDELMGLSPVVATNEPRLLEKLVELGVEFDSAELKSGEPVVSAIQRRCFSMVEPLVALGSRIPELESHWHIPYRQFLAWREVKGNRAPGQRKPGPPSAPDLLPEDATFIPGQKAIRQSAATWETAGESILAAVLIDGRTLRLCYSNGYSPLDGVELKARLGELKRPSREYADADDWRSPALVEEIVDIDEAFVPRSEFSEPAGEHPWFATWEIDLPVPEGTSRIEIAVKSPMDGIVEPVVLSDWQVER